MGKNYNLKVERENESYDEISFSFRFNNLLPEIAIEIKNLLNGHDIIFNKPRGKDFYVILFEEINESFDPNLISYIIKKYSLDEEDYGFWVSITSEFGHGGACLPVEIRKLYKMIGGQLDFSYMIGEMD